MYQDQTLTCKDCGKSFTWTASEQEFYASKGFSAPLRCPECRAKKKGMQTVSRGPRQMHEITCANCGAKGEVPFEPRDPSNVLCADCFRKKRDSERGGGMSDAGMAHGHDHGAADHGTPEPASSEEALPVAEVTSNGDDAAASQPDTDESAA